MFLSFSCEWRSSVVQARMCKLGRDPLIFLKILVVIGHVCIYWSKVAEGFSVFNAVLLLCIINRPTMAFDALAIQEAKVLTAMVLAYLSQDFALTPKGLRIIIIFQPQFHTIPDLCNAVHQSILQCCHIHECHVVSDKRQNYCLFNSLSRLTTQIKKSPLPVLCEENPPVTDGFPSQRASNAERVSISLRHPVYTPVHHVVSVCQHVSLAGHSTSLRVRRGTYVLHLGRRHLLYLLWELRPHAGCHGEGVWQKVSGCKLWHIIYNIGE